MLWEWTRTGKLWSGQLNHELKVDIKLRKTERGLQIQVIVPFLYRPNLFSLSFGTLYYRNIDYSNLRVGCDGKTTTGQMMNLIPQNVVVNFNECAESLPYWSAISLHLASYPVLWPQSKAQSIVDAHFANRSNNWQNIHVQKSQFYYISHKKGVSNVWLSVMLRYCGTHINHKQNSHV